MRIDLLTLFPEMFAGFLATSFVGRAHRRWPARGAAEGVA